MASQERRRKVERVANSSPIPHWLQTVVAVVVLGALYALAAQSRYAGGGDAPYHILSARAWAGGEGFHGTDPAHTKYPPGWSLALMLCQLIFGGSYADFARFTAALFPLALVASYLLFRRRADVSTAVWMTAALIASAACFDVATRSVRSEVLFTAASIGFLAWSESAMRSSRSSFLQIVWGALLLVATVLVRSIGVALMLAVVATALHLTLRNRAQGARFARRFALPLLAGGASLAVWKRLSSAQPVESYPGELMNLYNRQFWMRDPHRPGLGTASIMDVVLRIPDNLRQHAAHAAELLTNISWIAPSWTSPFVVAATVILVAGLVRELRRKLPLLVYYALAYVGILSVWPFDEGTRFLVPLFPVLLIFGASGWELLVDASRRAPRILAWAITAFALLELVALAVEWFAHPTTFGRQPAMSVVCWLLVTGGSVAQLVRHRRQASSEAWPALRLVPVAYGAAFLVLGASGIGGVARANWRADHGPGNGFQQASAWIARNSDRSAVVMAQRHLDFELTTGHPGALFPVTGDRATLVAALNGTRARYLVVYDTAPTDAYYFPLEADRLALLQSATPRRIVLRARMQDVSVFEAR